MTWSAEQYLRFEAERTRPVQDLLGALPRIDARRVIDLGCGPGNSTEVLAAHYPDAAIRGLDSSVDMITAARTRLPRTRFDISDIARWIREGSPGDRERFDVILANAVLHWLPDHSQLFPALAARLEPGGCLAVQMPDNLDEPAHCLMREIASSGPWAGKLSMVAKARCIVGSADSYCELMRCAQYRVQVWRTTYYHVLAGGAAAVVEWFRGSGLRPYLAVLDADERVQFLARYESALKPIYRPMTDGSILLPFPRLFIVACA